MDILSGNPDSSTLSIRNLKILLAYKRVKEDGKLPSLKCDLIKLWETIKDRKDTIIPPKTLDDLHVDTHSQDENEELVPIKQEIE